MSEIIIAEYSIGGTYMGSKVFQPTQEGYAKAMSEVQRIEKHGNVADGDTGRVMDYFGR